MVSSHTRLRSLFPVVTTSEGELASDPCLDPDFLFSGEDHAIRARTFAARDFRLETLWGFCKTGGDQLGNGRPRARVLLASVFSSYLSLFFPHPLFSTFHHEPLRHSTTPIILSFCILPVAKRTAPLPPPSRVAFYTRWTRRFLLAFRSGLFQAVPRPILRLRLTRQPRFRRRWAYETMSVTGPDRGPTASGVGRGGNHKQRIEREGVGTSPKRTGNHDVTSLVRRRSWGRRGPRPQLGRSCTNGTVNERTLETPSSWLSTRLCRLVPWETAGPCDAYVQSCLGCLPLSRLTCGGSSRPARVEGTDCGNVCRPCFGVVPFCHLRFGLASLWVSLWALGTRQATE